MNSEMGSEDVSHCVVYALQNEGGSAGEFWEAKGQTSV